MRSIFALVRSVSVVCACLIGAAGEASADRYLLDKQHTEVRFSWNHLAMSRQSGRFLDVTGWIDFDPARLDASRVDVEMKLASIATGVAALDTHLVKSKDFFDVAAHPVISFNSTDVKVTGERTAAVIGNLTINGISRSVVLEVVWNFQGEHPLSKINAAYADVQAVGFSARTQIFRSDWGITRSIPYVSDELVITIETEALKKPVARE